MHTITASLFLLLTTLAAYVFRITFPFWKNSRNPLKDILAVYRAYIYVITIFF